ncbi:hypothetical protein [Glutamicibacter ardleyensis]
MFERIDGLAEKHESSFKPESGSRLDFDNQRAPTRPISDYAHAQLSVATDCLQSLKRMILREQDKAVDMHLGPFAHYALIRNALDSLAIVIWLMEPESSTGRLKRLLRIECNEVELASKHYQSVGIRAWKQTKEQKLERIREIAVEAGIENWDPVTDKLSTTTKILGEIDRLRSKSSRVSWLSYWQLASGYAHGKRWAVLASGELTEQEGTATKHGATFVVTASYQFLDLLLAETLDMLNIAMIRYEALCRGK